MRPSKNRVTVEIYGDSYPLKSDADPEQIKKVAAFLDARIRETALSNPRVSTTRIAILAALNIADEYLRLKSDYQQLRRMVDK
jgi:Uncharacterized protein conserved in bacteria